jgi:hypothetical protein
MPYVLNDLVEIGASVTFRDLTDTDKSRMLPLSNRGCAPLQRRQGDDKFSDHHSLGRLVLDDFG